MNLYHLNTGVEHRVVLNANYDIRSYIDFISNSIEFLKRETLTIKVSKTVVQGQTRYSPVTTSNRKSEKAIELLFNENTENVFDQRDHFFSRYSFHIESQNEVENFVTLDRDIEGDRIFLKPDIYQLEQQRRALDILRNRPLKDHSPLLALFGFPESQVWKQNFYEKDFNWTILTDKTKDGVYEQREFVSKGVQTKDFALLEGPPGSGKTTTIIEMIMQFASEGKRVLLCSATHSAIDNVIERIKGRYKDICDQEIVPVRICNAKQHLSVKESVRPFLLQNLVTTYKADIEKHLKKNLDLESQQFLLKNLSGKAENEADPIEKIILDSANLVAGTMIGILQHPDIKANQQGASFDVLIVDEGSKVTFSDFIVPALHAKKWILVGDVKQLSPYVENDYVSENIAAMLDSEIQKSLIKQFELKSKLDDKKFDDCLKVFFTEQDPSSERQLLENTDLIVEEVDENWASDENNIVKINSADVLVAKNVPRVKQLLSSHIHVKSIFINGDTNSLHLHYRQVYARRKLKHQQYLFDSRDESWSEMVSSRLNQSFSFRNAGIEFENIDRELMYLVPSQIQEAISQIKRLVFPSILELLQNGIGKGSGQASNRVLSDGIHRQYKESRFVSLTYQHRMHPDIALTSKENFYESNLKSANTVLENREWEYTLNEPVVKWIYNNDSTGNRRGGNIINPTEVNDIDRELVKFLNWAKDNPRFNGENYEVAVLTFYRDQEAELRKRIRKITKQSFFSKFHKNNTDIFLYTVDKFQGQEADLVFLGFTKFTRDAHFNSPNRLNVALTRARHKVVLFGNRLWFKERAKLKALRYLATNFKSTIRYEK